MSVHDGTGPEQAFYGTTRAWLPGMVDDEPELGDRFFALGMAARVYMGTGAPSTAVLAQAEAFLTWLEDGDLEDDEPAAPADLQH